VVVLVGGSWVLLVVVLVVVVVLAWWRWAHGKRRQRGGSTGFAICSARRSRRLVEGEKNPWYKTKACKYWQEGKRPVVN
jgi:hypothetical protein